MARYAVGFQDKKDPCIFKDDSEVDKLGDAKEAAVEFTENSGRKAIVWDNKRLEIVFETGAGKKKDDEDDEEIVEPEPEEEEDENVDLEYFPEKMKKKKK